MATVKKILFRSLEGQKLLGESDTTYQPHLVKLFKKQIGAKTCSIQSTALLLSARHLGQHLDQKSGPRLTNLTSNSMIEDDDLPYTESNIFSYKETNKVLDNKALEEKGCTLDQLHSLFLAHSYQATKYYSNAVTLDTFRAVACKALSHIDSKCGVIINYDEAALGQDVNGKGHFSPLAGYNEATDMFLLLDTWWNTQDVWVKTEFLFEAMCTVDSASGSHRGFLILEE